METSGDIVNPSIQEDFFQFVQINWVIISENRMHFGRKPGTIMGTSIN